MPISNVKRIFALEPDDTLLKEMMKKMGLEEGFTYFRIE
jgi:hypothetical protein